MKNADVVVNGVKITPEFVQFVETLLQHFSTKDAIREFKTNLFLTQNALLSSSSEFIDEKTRREMGTSFYYIHEFVLSLENLEDEGSLLVE